MIESASEDSDSPLDPLLRFEETFVFKKFLEDFVVPCEDPDTADLVRGSAHLLGQCGNGEILFAWDKKTGEGELVTVVGLFSQQMKAHSTLYQHDSVAYICNASVNTERTLLAFTIKESAYEEDQSMYDSYIAEIHPQGRIFTLDIPTPDFRSLQFLHISSHSPKSRLIGKNTTVICRLLVVIPQVLISLYHFKMQQIQIGAVLLEQPKLEILQKNFSWYQWDPHKQWLYYARFEATSSKASMTGKHSLLLNCENFSVPSHPLLFTIALPLPYSEHMYATTSTYYNDPFAFTLPVREMNLQVLYRRDGFWCACLQHCAGLAINRGTTDGISSEGNKIDYTVYMIHNGHLLYGQVPLVEPSREPIYLHFMLVNCFVVAYIPNVMLHLLNVGPRVDPCHHLTFGSDYASFAVEDGLAGTHELGRAEECSSNSSSIVDAAPCLASAVRGSLASDYDTTIIDCNTSTIYGCILNIQALFTLFKATSDPVLKEDLLHLMVVGLRHHGMALSMIEHVCQTPLTVCDHKLFAEFIIASSYANVHFDCKKLFARQLPLTTAPTYHGKVSKNRDGGNRALLKLTQMPNFIKQLLVQSDQQLVMASSEELLNYDPPRDQAFENLCFDALLSQPLYGRIDIKKLPSLAASLQAPDPPPSASRPPRGAKKSASRPGTGAGGILNKIATFGRKSGSHTSSSPSGKSPRDMLSFLNHDKDVVEKVAAEATTIREQLVVLLTKGLPLRSKNIAYNTVSTYYNELEKQSCSLLLVIWQSLRFSADNHPLNSSLCRSPTTKEQILYELLEAYQLALSDLGLPLPVGFQTLFVSMGYLTQEKGLFLQYLRCGVFTPTKKFVELLLEDCDEEEDAKIIFQVFCNLDYTLSEFAFNNWHDPTIEKLEQP